MKRLLITAGWVAVFLSACTRENGIEENDAACAPEMQEVVLSAYSGDDSPSTRTSRDIEGNFYWSPEDRISLFYGSGESGGWMFTSTNSEAAPVAEFRGSMDLITGNIEVGAELQKFWGIYPYSEKNACYGSMVVAEVPYEQVAAEETFADGQFVSIGCSTALNMGFYHLCGGIKFFLQTPGITRITLQGMGNEVLAGTVEVTMDQDNHPTVSRILDPQTTVVLTPPTGQTEFETGVNYFFVTLPTTFTRGFILTFEKESEKLIGSREVSVEMSVNRAKFQWSEKPLDVDVDFLPTDLDVQYFDIENAGVRRYLEEVDYSDDFDTGSGYSYTKVKNYSGADKPEPVCLSWSGTASEVLLSTTRDFESDVTTIQVNGSSADVYNLIPGVTYYYRVSSDSGVQEGCFVPVGPLRMIKANAASNVRDLGGWKAQDGKSIAYGKLFRGTQTGSADHDLFVSLGISVDLDLRGNGGGSASQVFSDLEYLNLNVYQFMYKGTSGYTEDLYREALRRIIEWLDQGKGIYFHCIGGADRTGTLAFLIEALLGVEENDLNKDYELTYFSSQPRTRDNTSDRPFRQLVFYMKTFPGSTPQEQVTNWATTGENALTLEEIQLLKELMLE